MAFEQRRWTGPDKYNYTTTEAYQYLWRVDLRVDLILIYTKDIMECAGDSIVDLCEWTKDAQIGMYY